MYSKKEIIIAKQIIKECFWGDYKTTYKDILEYVITQKDEDFSLFIFDKIFQNSKNMIICLSLMDKEMVKKFVLRKAKILEKSNFRKEEFQKRIDILIYWYIDNKHRVKGLEWRI